VTIRAAILALSPDIYWPLDTLESPTIIDASGHGNTGILVGSVTTGLPGPETGTTALGTSAPDSGVQLSVPNPLVGTGPFTWMCWYASSVFTTSGHLLQGNGTPGGSNGESFYLAGSALNLVFSGIGTIATGQALLSSQWQQLCFSITPSVVEKAYVDGALALSTAAGVPHAITAADLLFAWTPNPAVIAHAAWWSRQLSDAEVASVWTAGPGLLPAVPMTGRASSDVDVVALQTALAACCAAQTDLLNQILANTQHTYT
jgi:hypothetical protein